MSTLSLGLISISTSIEGLISLPISFYVYIFWVSFILVDGGESSSIGEGQNKSYSMDQLIDMNEEDALAEINLEDTQPQAQQIETQVGESTQAPRKRRETSLVWEDFVSVGVEEDGKERAKCLHCGTKLVTRSETNHSFGTHHLQRHLDTCSKKPLKEAKPAYDQKIDRGLINEVIIYHDLPFRYVEYEKVRERDKYLNPEFQPICRQTAAADVFRKYEIEKEKLKKVFASHLGRVCFTSDLWTSRPHNWYLWNGSDEDSDG